MPEGQQPRGVTPSLRSGAAAESARLRRRRNGLQELPRVRGQGRRLRRDTLEGGQERQRRGATRVQDQGQQPEDQPHVQGAVAARAQEGLEELSHVESQEGRR